MAEIESAQAEASSEALEFSSQPKQGFLSALRWQRVLTVLPAWAGLMSIPTCVVQRAADENHYDQLSQFLELSWLTLAGVAGFGGFLLMLAYLSMERQRRQALIAMMLAWGGVIVSFIWGFSQHSPDFTIQHGRPLLLRRAWRKAKHIRPERSKDTARTASTGDSSATLAALQWIHNADAEWISVAAFSKLSMDLMVIGAPIALVRACHESALEEIHHAELCLDVARYLDPSLTSAATIRPVPALAEIGHQSPCLVEIAVESLVLGAYQEAVSGRVAGRLATQVTDARIRETLLVIERDELRHAALSWDILEYCIQVGDASMLRHLHNTRLLQSSVREDVPSLETYGLASLKLKQRIECELLPSVQDRLQELLGSAPRSLSRSC